MDQNNQKVIQVTLSDGSEAFAVNPKEDCPHLNNEWLNALYTPTP